MLCTLTVSLPTKHLDNRQKYREYRVRFRTHGRKFVMARCNFLLLFFCAFKCIFKCVLYATWEGGALSKRIPWQKGCLWVCHTEATMTTMKRLSAQMAILYWYSIKSFPSMANLSIFGKKLFFSGSVKTLL